MTPGAVASQALNLFNFASRCKKDFGTPTHLLLNEADTLLSARQSLVCDQRDTFSEHHAAASAIFLP
jgi:hypothetical protein